MTLLAKKSKVLAGSTSDVIVIQCSKIVAEAVVNECLHLASRLVTCPHVEQNNMNFHFVILHYVEV